MAETPGAFLKGLLGNDVEVRLIDKTFYRGKLITIDGLMSIVLQNAEEMTGDEVVESHREIFFRGNNVCYIHGKS